MLPRKHIKHQKEHEMTYVLNHTAFAPSRGLPLVTRLAQAIDLFRQRRALNKLGDAALKDIGITRDQAKQEARRASWDAPAHWLR